MDTLLQDIRYSLRTLIKNPGFSFVAMIALALGIGANTVVFSVVNTVLLSPLPFNDPDTLARVYEENREYGFLRQSATMPNFLDWREQNTVFQSMGAYVAGAANLTGLGEPERIQFASVTADFFSVLGVEPIHGRAIRPEEIGPGGPKIVVLSSGFWQSHYGGDPNIIGQTISLDGTPYTIVGILPARGRFPGTAQLWRPLNIDFSKFGRRSQWLTVIARLAKGVTFEQAKAEMQQIGQRLAEQYPEPNRGWGVAVESLSDSVVGNIRPALLVLLGAVGFVLLIACTNVANLLLARAATREKEMAIRAALGAARRRLVRQLLTESILLAVAGGAAGLLLAMWAVDALVSLSGTSIPRAKDIGVDGRVLGFSFIISLMTGMIFGLVPAFQASRTNLNETMKEGGRRSRGGSSDRVRSFLVVSQVALSLVLLVGAGLMIKSFNRLQQVSAGFNPEDVLTVRLSLPQGKYQQPASRASFCDQVIERITALPGVESAGAVVNLPLDGTGWSNSFTVEGRPPPTAGEFIAASNNRVSKDYFRAMQIPLARGRSFTERDAAGSPAVAVINETAARRFFADEDPIGKRLQVHDGGPTREIVGIVGDVRHDGLDADIRPMIYMPYVQDPRAMTLNLVVRTSSDPAKLAAVVQGEVRAADKDLPLASVRTMEEIVAGSVSSRRFSMTLLAIFAGVALMLAVVGIYGVMSYLVNQRRHEIGIRMALGARPRDVLRMILGHGLRLSFIGAGLGLASALALTRVLSGLLFGVSATDPLIFAVIPVVLVAAALGACAVPARRATKVDPMVALRYE
jgi:putative ABC transport system permease protein